MYIMLYIFKSIPLIFICYNIIFPYKTNMKQNAISILHSIFATDTDINDI